MTARGWAGAVAILTVSAAIVGCQPTSPDYRAIWTTNQTTTAPPAPEKPVPIWKFLAEAGVTGEPVAPYPLTDLTVSIPTPPGWTRPADAHAAPTTEVIAKGGTYPKAMLMVFRLKGEFNPTEAIKHGYADAELAQNFRRLDASLAPFHNFPSAMIQGSYDAGGTRLHGWNRIVIATGSPPTSQRYLVQLTITSLATQAVSQSSEIDAIIAGFVVAAK
ncbi:MAG: LpqN/LpqT family lipoprotein [Mycobacteriaceae bacterium]|nr:LpqN/LpqT family lipoprotein [Mycobacteriaceae bacterium]